MRNDLRFCKRKSTDQTKQISELQNMLADQQKQTLEYANRLDENDKKSEEMSRKISTLLQELNKCKIELHYWRSKSPATPICNNCGQTTLTLPSAADDILAFMNQSLSTDDVINVTGTSDLDMETEVQSHESSLMDLALKPTQLIQKATTLATAITSTRPVITSKEDANKATPSSVITSSSIQSLSPISTIAANADNDSINNKNGGNAVMAAQHEQNKHQHQIQQPSVILNAASLPKLHGKRRWDGNYTVTDHSILRGQNGNGSNRSPNHDDGSAPNKDDGIGTGTECITSTSTPATKSATNIANTTKDTNNSDNCNKKARRVQSKIKCQTNNANIKTRNK